MRTSHSPQRLLALTLIAALLAASTLDAQRPLKVYISVDMEGIAGVVTADQLGPAGFEYGRAREFMTGEALAAIAGARDAGATQIVVSDSHGNGESLLIEKFPPDVTIIRSWPRPLMMMQGIDSTFDAAVFIGYHASTTNPEGVRAHTMSSANLADVRHEIEVGAHHDGGARLAGEGADYVSSMLVDGLVFRRTAHLPEEIANGGLPFLVRNCANFEMLLQQARDHEIYFEFLRERTASDECGQERRLNTRLMTHDL